MDYPLLKVKLLTAMRADRSSADLSRQLGYSFNQVRRWEQGQKQLRWDEFCDYCELLKIPLADIVNKFNLDASASLELEELKKYTVRSLRERFSYLTLETLANKLNCHLSVLKRYLKGQTSPDVEFVFAMIDLKENWLANFISSLVPQELNSDLHRLFEIKETAPVTEIQIPFACAVENTFDLEPYKRLPQHSDEFVAETLGCSVLEVRTIINRMLAAGTIAMNEQGKYETTYKTINTEGVPDPKALVQMVRFWIERSALRLTDEGAYTKSAIRGLTSYRVAPVSIEGMKKINEILRKAQDEIGNLLENDPEPREEVRVLLMQTFSVGDIPPQQVSSVLTANKEPEPQL